MGARPIRPHTPPDQPTRHVYAPLFETRLRPRASIRHIETLRLRPCASTPDTHTHTHTRRSPDETPRTVSTQRCAETPSVLTLCHTNTHTRMRLFGTPRTFQPHARSRPARPSPSHHQHHALRAMRGPMPPPEVGPRHRSSCGTIPQWVQEPSQDHLCLPLTSHTCHVSPHTYRPFSLHAAQDVRCPAQNFGLGRLPDRGMPVRRSRPQHSRSPGLLGTSLSECNFTEPSTLYVTSPPLLM